VAIDCGADHRLIDPADWAAFYGGEHPGTWTYGLPELACGWTQAGPVPKCRGALAGTHRVAVPGCNVTAVSLALAPGIAAGLLEPSDLVAVLANGVSGAGRAGARHLLAAEVLGGVSAYSVGGTHRHIPEILQNLRRALGQSPSRSGDQAGIGHEPSISFTPTLVPMARGILATVTARLTAGTPASALRGAWEKAYGDEPFVRLLPEGSWPATQATLGSNAAQIQLAYDNAAGRAVILCAIDNLGKGTAGAAIQSMNLALGLPEAAGLTTIGVAP
jgi:N-acetyl-gamma-glutamyl-phosphate reductase